jgi:hypothetical protein
MTATPHRGKEWLFLHLVDPDIYPNLGSDANVELPPLRPGPVHFLRRMKEDLPQGQPGRRIGSLGHRVPRFDGVPTLWRTLSGLASGATPGLRNDGSVPEIMEVKNKDDSESSCSAA